MHEQYPGQAPVYADGPTAQHWQQQLHAHYYQQQQHPEYPQQYAYETSQSAPYPSGQGFLQPGDPPQGAGGQDFNPHHMQPGDPPPESGYRPGEYAEGGHYEQEHGYQGEPTREPQRHLDSQEGYVSQQDAAVNQYLVADQAAGRQYEEVYANEAHRGGAVVEDRQGTGGPEVDAMNGQLPVAHLQRE
jgi:hypothetical protein